VILSMDQDSTVLYVNPSVERVFGYLPSEVIGHKTTMLMSENTSEQDAILHAHLQTGDKRFESSGFELLGRHKCGREIPIEISFGEARGDTGRSVTAIIRDISERKRAAQELRCSEQNYRSMVE